MAAVLWTAAARANAQTIVGSVVDQTQRPVAGVLVLMLDSASNAVARALTSERGTFRVATPRAGTYRLRTMRIGYKPTTSAPIPLLAGGQVEKQVTLTGALVGLDTIRIVDRGSCKITSDAAAAATFAVWEQARTALTATALTTASRAITATTVSFDRTMDPEGRQTLQQKSNSSTAIVTQPWRTVSADSLHRAGYVIVDRNGTVTYHAPSIDALLSNVFLDDHCFRLTTDKKRANQVGIQFEPSGDRKRVAEVKGTIWVDRASSELRELEYRYTNLSQEQESVGAGGVVEFGRMLNGGWAITRWSVTMPVLEREVRSEAMGGIGVHVVGLQVTGGELTLATQASPTGRDTIWRQGSLVEMAAHRDSLANALKIADALPALARFTGVIVDSLDAPLANAQVLMLGVERAAISDAKGTFTIGDVPAGDQQVSVRRIGYAPLDTKVPFAPGASVERKLVMHRMIVLDSVVVKAQRIDLPMVEFEENRKLGLGHFLTRSDLAKRENVNLGDVLRQIPGVAVRSGRSNRAWAYTTRSDHMCVPGTQQPPTCSEANGVYFPDTFESRQGMIPKCYARIYLDDNLLTPGDPTQPFDVSTIPVTAIEAIEFYAGPAETPLRYTTRNSLCGVIVVHTRRP